jgi:hypothetical protein
MWETRQHYYDCGLLGYDTALSVRIKVFSSTAENSGPNFHVSSHSCNYFVQTCCLCSCRDSRFLLNNNHECIPTQNTTIYIIKHHKILISYKINTFFSINTFITNTSTKININMLYVVTSKEIGLQVNAEIFSCLVNRLHDKTTSFESVAKFKYMRTITHQRCIHEEIMNRLN